jgi:copper(I)-binding protein
MSSNALCRLGLCALLFAASAAHAQITVADAWIRGTVAGQNATGAFMQITSATGAMLVGAASPAARVVELHEMKMAGDMAKMSAIDKLPLPAGKVVELKPGGYHVMLMDLVAPLKEGETVPVTLTFVDKDGKRTTQEIRAKVRALTTDAGKMK